MVSSASSVLVLTHVSKFRPKHGRFLKILMHFFFFCHVDAVHSFRHWRRRTRVWGDRLSQSICLWKCRSFEYSFIMDICWLKTRLIIYLEQTWVRTEFNLHDITIVYCWAICLTRWLRFCCVCLRMFMYFCVSKHIATNYRTLNNDWQVIWMDSVVAWLEILFFHLSVGTEVKPQPF